MALYRWKFKEKKIQDMLIIPPFLFFDLLHTNFTSMFLKFLIRPQNIGGELIQFVDIKRIIVNKFYFVEIYGAENFLAKS